MVFLKLRALIIITVLENATENLHKCDYNFFQLNVDAISVFSRSGKEDSSFQDFFLVNV